MSTPDVRVRLSAEGVAEVVSAFKKIQAESDKSGKKGRQSFLEFNSVLSSTRSLLGALGLALGIQQIVSFIREASRATDELGKLSQKVGASVENLSALQFAAATASVSNEELAKGLIQLNKRIGEFGDGLEEPRRAFADLGLTLRDFQGKDAAERLEVVARRLGELEDGTQKTKLAMKLFEEAGAQLIPLLNDVARKGLSGVTDEARKLGVLFDTETVAVITKMNDDLAILNRQFQLMAAQFLSGLAPAISQSAGILSGSLTDAGDNLRQFGEGVGFVVKGFSLLALAFDNVGTILGVMAVRIANGFHVITEVAKGNLREAQELSRAAARTVNEELDNLAKRNAARLAAFSAQPGALPSLSGQGTETIDPKEIARRRAEAARAGLDAELAIVRAQARLRSQAEQEAFEDGLRSVQEFYAERQRIVEEQVDQEVETLLAKKALLSAETDEIKAQAEAKKIDAQIEEIRINQQGELARLQFESARATRDLAAKSLGIERQILDAQGRRHEAALLAIDEEIDKADLLYRQQGFNDEQRLRGLDRLRSALTNSANFRVAQEQANAALTELGRERARIDAEVDAGQRTQLQGQRALRDIESRRIGDLRELARQLLAAASATGDPANIEQARAFADSVEAIGSASEHAGVTLLRFQEALEQSSLAALTDFFDDSIEGANNLGEAARNMAQTVVAALRRVAAEALSTRIFQGLTSLFTRSGGGARRGDLVGSAARRFSAGGLLSGPGTGTSDSILAFTDSGRPVRFSNKEFVVQAARVREPGALNFLRRFNESGMKALREASPEDIELLATYRPKFPTERSLRRLAGGDLVGGAAGAVSSSPVIHDGRSEQVDIGIHANEETLRLFTLKVMKSHDGQKATVRNVALNRRLMRDVR